MVGRYDSLVVSFHDVIDNRPHRSYRDEENVGGSRGQYVTAGVILVKNLFSVKKSQALFKMPPECAHKVRSLITRASQSYEIINNPLNKIRSSYIDRMGRDFFFNLANVIDNYVV